MELYHKLIGGNRRQSICLLQNAILLTFQNTPQTISLILNIDQDNRSMYTGHLSSYIILERDLLKHKGSSK